MAGEKSFLAEDIFKEPGRAHKDSQRWSTGAAQDIWSQPAHQPRANGDSPQHNVARSQAGMQLPTFEDLPHRDHPTRSNDVAALHSMSGRSGSTTDSQLQAKIAEVASHAAGKQMYLPREGSRYKGYHIDPTFGCTSASTNLLFDGLKAAGRVSDSDYRRVHQIANEKAYTMLQKEHLAKPVSNKEIKPGDWVYFKDKGESSGHSGVVFRNKHGELMVANNTSGKMMADNLKEMVDEYDTTKALRPILHPEQNNQNQSKKLIADDYNAKTKIPLR